jgi:uncharacterized protein
MKKLALVIAMFTAVFANAQVAQSPKPQIVVNGEGKITVAPDQADIVVGVTNTGADAAEVKKANDAAIDAVIKFIKSQKLQPADYQTQRVNLNRNYDYNKKKYSYVASQTIVIHLKDLSKYEGLMMGLTDAGINTIEGVTFKTSKQADYESEARIKAVADAKKKAGDYASALNQGVGKAITVNDNSQILYPQVYRMAAMDMKSEAAPQETLAIGEITIIANVNIAFELL